MARDDLSCLTVSGQKTSRIAIVNKMIVRPQLGMPILASWLYKNTSAAVIGTATSSRRLLYRPPMAPKSEPPQLRAKRSLVNRIIPARIERMAPTEPTERPPSAANHSVALDRFVSVLRARRIEPTGLAEQARQRALIEPNRSQGQKGHASPRLPGSRATYPPNVSPPVDDEVSPGGHLNNW